MTRRIQFVGAMALVAGAGVAVWLRRSPSAADFPRTAARNILLITIDTLRGDAPGCYGGPAATPVIDGLAQHGVRFTFAHAHTVITLPSHASILTGLYPFQHGYRENSGYRLKPGTPTLATLLKGKGFATAAFLGAFPLDARFGLTPGFDVYDGRFDDAGVQGVFVLPERPAPAVVSRADAWIAKQSGPWFAWVHLFDPHAPYEPPSPYAEQYADRPYYGEVAAVDHALAPLLDTAASSSRPTLVVLTGDHGEALGDHGESTHGLFAYESTLRIPLIIAEIGHVRLKSDTTSDQTSWLQPDQPGETVDTPVRHIDILPTILDTLGIDAPGGLPGRSLRRQANRLDREEHPSYFEAMSSMLEFGWAPLQGVLARREKYIDLPIPEVYDLAADPGERTNILDANPTRQRRLAARLADFHADLPGTPQREDVEVLARLKALGYISGSAPAKTRYTEHDDPKHLVTLDRLLHEGVALDQQQRTDEAIAKYRAILEQRPDMMSAARHLAFDQWKTGQGPEAVATLRTTLKASEPTTGAQVQLATYLAEGGRPADAIQLLEPIAATSSVDLDTLNALAIAYARAGRTKDALLTFQRSLAIDPSNAMTLENIGTTYLHSGDIGRAKQAFERALSASDTSSQAHAGLAMIALKEGNREAAIREWTRAVRLDATNYDALYDLGVQLLQTGRQAEARPYLEQFVRTAPKGLYAEDIKQLSRVLNESHSR